MNTKPKKAHWSWEVFVGLMFVGMGIGLMVGETAAGMFLGMGAGFILASLVKIERPKVTIEPPTAKIGLLSIVAGIVFILMGLGELGIVQLKEAMSILWGVILILLGLAFIFGGITLLKSLRQKH